MMIKRNLFFYAILSSIILLPTAIKAAGDGFLVRINSSCLVNMDDSMHLVSVKFESYKASSSMKINHSYKGDTCFFINGKMIEDGGEYLFGDISSNRKYELLLKKGERVVKKGYLSFTSLPILCLDGEWGYNYANGEVCIYQSCKEPEKTLCKAKWRGGATNSANRHKRNYHVKLLDKTGENIDKNFLGMRKDNSWILDAGQVDMIRIRNRITTDLWNDFCAKPYYVNDEPKARLGNKGEFIELVVNGTYQGIYSLNEDLDRKQMKVKKITADTEVHGQFWKTKEWSYAVFMGHDINDNTYPMISPSKPLCSDSYWLGIEAKYPNLENMPLLDWDVIYNAVNFVCTASEQDFGDRVDEYFYIPVLIDYYILMELTLSVDNHGKNMIYACYDKQKSKKLTIGAWDMDEVFGQSYFLSMYYHDSHLRPEQDYSSYIEQNEHGDFNLFRRLKTCSNGKYEQKIKERYWELRKIGVLQVDSILNRFRNAMQIFNICGATMREQQRWDGDEDIQWLNLDMNNELSYIEDWVQRRIEYLDKNRFKISTGIVDNYNTLKKFSISSHDGNLYIISPCDTTLFIYSLQGKLYLKNICKGRNVIGGLGKGVYIINNKKIVL